MPRGVYERKTKPTFGKKPSFPRQEHKQLAEVIQMKQPDKPKRTYANRPHWKSVSEELAKRLEEAERELNELRKYSGGAPVNIPKLKAEAFIAGAKSVVEMLGE